MREAVAYSIVHVVPFCPVNVRPGKIVYCDYTDANGLLFLNYNTKMSLLSDGLEHDEMYILLEETRRIAERYYFAQDCGRSYMGCEITFLENKDNSTDRAFFKGFGFVNVRIASSDQSVIHERACAIWDFLLRNARVLDCPWRTLYELAKHL